MTAALCQALCQVLGAGCPGDHSQALPQLVGVFGEAPAGGQEQRWVGRGQEGFAEEVLVLGL